MMLARTIESKEIKKDGSKISMTPSVLIKHISDHLSYSESYKFASASRYLFFTLNHNNALKNRPDHMNFVALKLDSIIKQALIGIDKYLKQDAGKPYSVTLYGPFGAEMYTTSYPKGYRRAMCFQDILLDEHNSIPVRVFALYVLLRESNGKKLKSKVLRELVPKFGINYLKMVENYLLSQFSLDKIKIMQKKLLKTIHNKQGPIPDNDDFYEGNFEKGFMGRYIVEIVKTGEEIQTSNSRCVVM